ncbi:hypothetical protein PACILC2_27830 [Paenibacillus cisolokensis]|uniref:Stage II sporulation protein E N-terminal domain-containing protein n=1 Tax=Paenibacillus cisolokensis TaxID=1658519 RepID=A0ABQ4N7K8_9BACL|nr:hypothetical protein PACILC2_27830 [Paenibacillus cisolokensis]
MDKNQVVMFPGSRRTSFMQTAIRKGRESAASSRIVRALSAKKWTLLLVAIGFLLGRAVLLESLMPFAAAYFAVIHFMRKDASRWVALSLVAGSFFAMTPEPVWIAMELAVLYLLIRGMEAYEKSEISYAPLLVFMATLLVRLFDAFIDKALGWYDLTMIGVEASLAFVLTLVFMQAVPVLTMTRKSASLKTKKLFVS